MKKEELIIKTDAAIEEVRYVILTIYNSLNQGQQNKILKDDDVKAIFDRYGIEY